MSAVTDFQDVPIEVDSLVCYNLSGELAVGLVTKVERQKNFSHRNIHVKLIKSAGYDATERGKPLLRQLQDAAGFVGPISKVKDKGVMVMSFDKHDLYHRFAFNPKNKFR